MLYHLKKHSKEIISETCVVTAFAVQTSKYIFDRFSIYYIYIYSSFGFKPKMCYAIFFSDLEYVDSEYKASDNKRKQIMIPIRKRGSQATFILKKNLSKEILCRFSRSRTYFQLRSRKKYCSINLPSSFVQNFQRSYLRSL